MTVSGSPWLSIPSSSSARAKKIRVVPPILQTGFNRVCSSVVSGGQRHVPAQAEEDRGLAVVVFAPRPKRDDQHLRRKNMFL